MSKGTALQRLRCDPELWASAEAPLEAAGTNRSAAIRGFLATIAEADPDRVAEILKQFPPK
jgi:antitoxin component of RelBE/YafQ-DinJ toxin-antitoxin module